MGRFLKERHSGKGSLGGRNHGTEELEAGKRSLTQEGRSKSSLGKTWMEEEAEKGSINIFCEGLEGKYFRVCGPYCLCHNSSIAIGVQCNHRQYVNKWILPGSNKTLFTNTGGGPVWPHRP